jgi:hypothetical protein
MARITANRHCRSFLRHSGLAQPGEISGFEQGACLRRPPISDGPQDGPFADSSVEGDGFEPSVPGDTPWVMENVDNLAEPAGRLSQSTTLRGCYVPALVKGSMAWLLCLPVGQALPLASSYRSTLFFFRRGTNGSNPFPSSGESPTNRARRVPPEGRQLSDGQLTQLWERQFDRPPRG